MSDWKKLVNKDGREVEALISAVQPAAFPSWFVPETGFRFWDREAPVIVLGYDSKNGLRAEVLMDGDWLHVMDLAEFGADDWAHCAPWSSPRCPECSRVDCHKVGGPCETCAPITYEAPRAARRGGDNG